jgi:hypothetical protein
MNLHNNWMTDNTLFGSNYEKSLTISLAIDRFDKQRYESAEGFSVIIDGTIEQVVIQNHISLLNLDKEDKKTFCSLDSNIKRGSLVYYDNNYYIVASKIDTTQAYLFGRMLKCTQSLRWLDGTQLNEYNCIISNRQGDIITNQYVILPANKFGILLSLDDNTDKLIRDKRFIFNDGAFKIISTDKSTMPGLVELIVEEDIININDNTELQIANYSDISYGLTILNGLTASLDITKTLQLNVEVKCGNNILINPIVVYSSSNPLKVTVNSLGVVTPIALGGSIITTTSNGVSNSINITVVNTVIVDNYLIVISGNEDILYGANETYTAIVTNNGNVENKSVTWSITIGSNYGSIVSQNGTTCVLKNIASGTVVLNAQFTLSGVISETKTITCKGMW